jgi:hypothetical protein
VKNLLERAATLDSALLSRGQKEAGDKLLDQLVVVQSRAEGARRRFETIEEIRAELPANGVLAPEVAKGTLELARKTKKSLRLIATALEKDDSSEQELVHVLARSSMSTAMNSLPKIESDITKAVEKSITAHRLTILPRSLEEIVPEVPGKTLVVSRLKICRERLSSPIVILVDITDERFKDVATILGAIRKDVDYWEKELSGVLDAFAKQSPELQAFLVAVSSPEGAPLQMITPEVLEMLRDNETISEYRVRSL